MNGHTQTGVGGATLVFFTAQMLIAQEPLSFDVASIRPSQQSRTGGEGRMRESIKLSPDGVQLRNITLSSCIQTAYGVKFYQVSGPDWLKTERFDIQAKTEARATQAQTREMLQSLLAERFKLTLHRETKEQPILALVVTKNGAKLRASDSEGESDMGVADGSFVYRRVSMPDFAEKLADLRTIDRPVVDQTGISGLYDITLQGAAAAVLRDDGPSVSTLLQEQLGLRLESRKGPIEILVVDHAEKRPTGN